MKKLIMLTAAVLTAAAITACRSAESNPPAASAPAENPAPAPEAPEPEPEEKDTSLDIVMEKGEIVIGLDDTFAPMGFRDEGGNLVGFDIDLAEAVCEEIGVKPVFQPIDWDAKQFELDGGNIDCIWNGMSITPDRMESMSLTRGYLNNRIIVMTIEGINITEHEELGQLQVGVQADSSALEVARAHEKFDTFQYNLHEYRSYDECIMDMQAGRIQAMIVDEVLGSYKNTALGEIFTVTDVDFGDDLYAIGFRKGEEALTKRVEQAIDALIENGKAAEISNKWFAHDIVIKP